MALFQKETCAHCGGEAGMLTRKKFADKKYVCGDCIDKCGDYYSSTRIGKINTYEEFCEYLQHKNENRQKLEQFNITDKYFDVVAVDMDKGWFIFGKEFLNCSKETLLRENPEVFEAKDLCYFNFDYVMKDVKEGVFSTKVKADVLFTIAFNNRWHPYAFFGKVLKNHNHKAEIHGFFKRNVIFTENEKKSDLDAYLTYILSENRIGWPIWDKKYKHIDELPNFEECVPYIAKFFELKKLGIIDERNFDISMEIMAPNKTLRREIKKRFNG